MAEGPTEPNNADRRDRLRLTVPEAATVLGVTVDAVRGRIRRGKLEAEHENGAVYVLLDAEEVDRPRPSRASRGRSPTGGGPSPDDSRLVEALEDRIASLERQLEDARQVNRENRRLLAAALERIPAIEPPGPRDEPEAARQDAGGVEDRGEPAEAQTDAQEPEESAHFAHFAQTPRRPWWRRIFGG
ncbi:MAG: helix-turn-helix domain-containing protein [Actinomycetota bacterium]|nr:helix-turn-helix domain-containing protein [Actinomycetota bacterium]